MYKIMKVSMVHVENRHISLACPDVFAGSSLHIQHLTMLLDLWTAPQLIVPYRSQVNLQPNQHLEGLTQGQCL